MGEAWRLRALNSPFFAGFYRFFHFLGPLRYDEKRDSPLLTAILRALRDRMTISGRYLRRCSGSRQVPESAWGKAMVK